MTALQIKALQSKIGAEPDGFWGPKSIAAAKAHLASLAPKKSPWPKTDESSLRAFYGEPGDSSNLVKLDVSDLCVKYEGGKVNSIHCHSKIAASLRRVLEQVCKTHPRIAALYAGVYNNRKMRGGTKPSLHARGAAIDLDPGSNGNNSHWPTKANMPIEVMEHFAREGWLCAGAEWSRDAMHFQATQ